MLAISTNILGPLSQFSPLYPVAFMILPLSLGTVGKITRINYAMLFLLVACIISIFFTDTSSVFKPWQRLGYFFLLILTVSPLISSKKLDIFRMQTFQWCMKLCAFIGVISVFFYFLNINYMSSVRTIGNSLSGTFGGITTQSMLLGPIAGISLNWLLFQELKSYFSKHVFSYTNLLMMCMCLCSILLSSSRGAFAATLLTAAYVIFMFSKNNLLKSSKLIFVFLLLMLAAFPLLSKFSSGLQSKQNANIEAGSTFSSREQLWYDRIKEFKTSPIYGIGFASQKEIPPDLMLTLQKGTIEPGTSYGAILAMTGILGSIPFLYILLTSIAKRPSALSGMQIISPPQVCLVFFGLHMIGEGYIFAAGSPLCALFWLSVGAASAWQCKYNFQS